LTKTIELTPGELLAIFRNRKGFTQNELGQLAFADLLTPNVKIKKFEKNQQRLSRRDMDKVANVLGIESEWLRYGKLTMTEDMEDDLSEKEATYQITKKMDSMCPNFSEYIKAINAMAAVDKMDVAVLIFQEMCAEFLSTKDKKLL
jgi:transcriptional regulator with XRE-family HTH domain